MSDIVTSLSPVEESRVYGRRHTWQLSQPASDQIVRADAARLTFMGRR
jgi:hypothetical protein